VTDVSESYQIFGLPAGAAIQTVAENSPAQKAGLQIGDIVTKAGDREITCGDDLIRLIKESHVGDTMTLTVYRKGQTTALTVTIGEQIQSATSDSEQQQRPGTGR
jgi:S1-C subfamily serine protease